MPKNFFSFTSQNARLLAYAVDGKMLGLDKNGIAGMCFGFLANLFTELTVHACNMFTHLKLKTIISDIG